jgi:hypothetical protein
MWPSKSQSKICEATEPKEEYKSIAVNAQGTMIPPFATASIQAQIAFE